MAEHRGDRSQGLAAVMQDSRRRPSQIPELDRSIALGVEGRPA